MENLYFSRGHGRNFDYLVFDHSYFEILAMVMVKNLWPQYMTMTPGRRSNGRKIVVASPPPYITTKQFVFAAKILFLIIAWTA